MLLCGFYLCQVFLLLVLVEHWPNVPIRFVDLLAALGARQYYFSAGEDKQHDLRLLHFEDESGKQFGLIVAPGQLFLFLLERFELDAEADVAAGDDVLDLELGHLDGRHQRFALLRSCLLRATLLRSTIEHLLNRFLKDFTSAHGPML